MDLIASIAILLGGQDVVTFLSLVNYLVSWVLSQIVSSEALLLMTSHRRQYYPQSAPKTHPRSRMFRELLVDIVYPIMHRILQGSLRRGAKLLKRICSFVFLAPYHTLIQQIEGVRVSNMQPRSGRPSGVLGDESSRSKGRSPPVSDLQSLFPSIAAGTPSPELGMARQSNTEFRAIEEYQMQNVIEEMTSLAHAITSLSTRLESLASVIASSEYPTDGMIVYDHDHQFGAAPIKLPVSILRGTGEVIISSVHDVVAETHQAVESPLAGYVVDATEDVIDVPPSRAPSPSDGSSFLSMPTFRAASVSTMELERRLPLETTFLDDLKVTSTTVPPRSKWSRGMHRMNRYLRRFSRTADR